MKETMKANRNLTGKPASGRLPLREPRRQEDKYWTGLGEVTGMESLMHSGFCFHPHDALHQNYLY
jgi:hypothetical protein